MKHWRITLLANGVQLGAGILSGILLARSLGADDRGLLAAITYWPHFIVGILAMGLNEGVVLQVAAHGRSKTLAITSVAMALMLAIAAAAVCWVLLGAALGDARGDYLGFARAYAWVLAPSSYICLALLGVYQGEMHFSKFNSMRSLQAGAYPMALACLWFSGLLTVRTAAWSALLGGIVVATLLLQRFARALKARPSFKEGRAIADRSVRLHAVNILMALTEQVDKMVLVLWSTNAQMGKYVVAYTAAAAGPAVLTQTYINVMLPAAARAQGSLLGYDATIRSMKIMLAVVVASAVVMIALLPVLLPLAFGREFIPATPYAQVLTVALNIYGMRKCMVYLLRSWHVTRPSLFGEALTASCIIAGGYPAFAHAGVIGLCWLLVVAQLSGTVFIWREFMNHAKQRRQEHEDREIP